MKNVLRHYRWRICALLFVAITINYLDRQVLGILKPELAARFHWTETDYGYVVTVFAFCYALGMVFAGKFADRFGVKMGYSVCVLVWSLACCGHAFIRNMLGFGVMRAFLGLAEAGSFPCAVKAVSEWFPRKEQSLAVGIITSGTSIGAVLAPALVPWLAVSFGWQSAFLLTGIPGFIWFAFWYVMYYAPQKHPRVTPQELQLIRQDKETVQEQDDGQTVGWFSLFQHRATWSIVVGKGMTDPIWWFLLFWLPSYFNSRFNLDLQHLGLPLIIVYVSTSIGSVLGGWAASTFIARGWSVSRARQTTMLGLAVLVMPLMTAPWIDNMWIIVGLLSLTVAAHQGWSANMFTLASDMFPKRVVASVVGIGGMASGLTSALFPFVVGAVLDHFKVLGKIGLGYNVLFIICGFTYIAAWLCMRLIYPSQQKVPLTQTAVQDVQTTPRAS
ncbi:Putative hexuronate transporter [Sodalis praecaptivus]|uniref:Putative hexuronate transporter n=1 Tax=Sodalis praecaptivus TaxID=1239307 RepID=W0I1F7_9GAMM|nr:MFS transporter [Sodalis praecaptivus]AHF78283.1 Putative hexuronate transporter [Sodalis praecaptivus]